MAGVLEGAGKAAKGAGDWLTDVLFKNPVEILQNPETILTDSGQISIPRLLFPNARRQIVADRQAQSDAYRAETQLKTMSAMGKLADAFGGMATDTAQGEMRKGLVAQGMDPAMLQPFANAAKAERHAARRAGSAAGLLPEVAGIADIGTGQAAGQSEFSDRLMRERADHQAQITRGNQSHASGLAAGNILLRDRLAQARQLQAQAGGGAGGGVGGPAKTAGERNGLRDLKALRVMMRKGQVPENIRPQAEAALKGKSGRLAYNVLTNLGYQGRTAAPAQVMANPAYREAADRARAAESARVGLQSVEQAAMTPDGAGIDPSLFSPASAGFLPDSASGQSLALSMFGGENAERKQNLLSTAAKNLGDYVLRMTGKVSNIHELERLKTVAPTGNEASGQLFASKVRAFDRALQREAEVAAKEAEMIGSGMTLGQWQIDAMRGEYDEIVRQLTAELSAVEQDPDAQPDGPLTPAEQAELEKYRAQR